MIIDSIRGFILKCPLVKDNKINVDYLGVTLGEYTIDTVPAESIIKQYVDGATLRQYVFVFGSKESYSPDIQEQIENSGFYEKFADWLEEQSKKGNLPELESNCKAQDIVAITSGYLFDNDSDMARYQIQCRLIYYKE